MVWNRTPGLSARLPKRPEIRGDGGSTDIRGTLIALRTATGVVLVADARASDDTAIESESVQKIHPVHPTAAMGSPAIPGPALDVIRGVEHAADQYEFDRGQPMDFTALRTVATDAVRARPSTGRFVLGGVADAGSRLSTIDPDQGALEEEYVAIGSGRSVASAQLDSADAESYTLEDARERAILAIRAAISRDVHTGPGGHIVEVTDAGVSIEAVESFENLA